MPSQITNYQCPACGGPLHFSPETGRLVCDYCGSTYTTEEVEAFYREKDEAAAAAMEAEAEKKEKEKEEAAAQAAQWKLNNLICVVDENRLSSSGVTREVIDNRDLAAKFRAFGWTAETIDGHDMAQILCPSIGRSTVFSRSSFFTR